MQWAAPNATLQIMPPAESTLRTCFPIQHGDMSAKYEKLESLIFEFILTPRDIEFGVSLK
jgi:hypothetical protein